MTAAPEWPPEVTLSHAIEDVIAQARTDAGQLDLDALAVAADRLTDLVGSLQERKAA